MSILTNKQWGRKGVLKKSNSLIIKCLLKPLREHRRVKKTIHSDKMRKLPYYHLQLIISQTDGYL